MDGLVVYVLDGYNDFTGKTVAEVFTDRADAKAALKKLREKNPDLYGRILKRIVK